MRGKRTSVEMKGQEKAVLVGLLINITTRTSRACPGLHHSEQDRRFARHSDQPKMDELIRPRFFEGDYHNLGLIGTTEC